MSNIESKTNPEKSDKADHSPEKPEETQGSREKILEVAIRLFAEKGLAGTSTREIAKESGANISLISYYFGGKEGLYKAVFREQMLHFQQQAEETIFKNLKKPMTKAVFHEAMSQFVTLILEKRKQDPSMINLMMRERIAGLPYAREAHEEIIAPMAHRLVGLIEEAQKQNIVRSDINPHTFFILMIESIWGYIQMSECQLSFHKAAHKIKKSVEEFKQAVLDIYLRGILK